MILLLQTDFLMGIFSRLWPSAAVEHAGEDPVHPTVGLLVWQRSNTQFLSPLSGFQIFQSIYKEEIPYCERGRGPGTDGSVRMFQNPGKNYQPFMRILKPREFN